MENQKQSHVGGVPFALILFTVGIAFLIDVPAWFFGFAPLKQEVANNVQIKYVKVPVVVTPTVVPTATPSAAFVPFKKVTPVGQSREVTVPVVPTK